MIVVGTGHRPEHFGNLRDPHELMPAIEILKTYLVDLAGDEPCEVVSGMAEGFDLMLAWAALMLAKQGKPFTLTAAMPWRGFCDRIRNARAKDWAMAALSRAESDGHVHFVAKAKPPKIENKKKPGQLVEDTRRINGVLFQRNVWMISRLQLKTEAGAGNLLLAAWDGVLGQRSGTFNTLRYAWRAFDLPPLNIYDAIAEALKLPARVPASSFDYARVFAVDD